MGSFIEQLQAIKKMLNLAKETVTKEFKPNSETKKHKLFQCEICNARVKNIIKHNKKAHKKTPNEQTKFIQNKQKKKEKLSKKIAKETKNQQIAIGMGNALLQAYDPIKKEYKYREPSIANEVINPIITTNLNAMRYKIERCQHCGEPAIPGDNICRQCSSE